MKNCILIAFIIVLSVMRVHAQDYSVAAIPDSLKENAHCVIRDYTKEIIIKSINSGTEKIRKVVTILDKEGENKAYLAIHYDKNTVVFLKQATLYNAGGKKIRKIKQSEIFDAPAFSEFALYADDRIKLFKPDYAEYPYSIEYDYVLSLTNLISYGDWSPIVDYDISVEHAKLIFSFPHDIKINKKEINCPSKPNEIQKDDIMIDTWELNGIKAIEDEPYDISISERTPGVYLMPSELIYDNFKGAANNWEEYGSWVRKLYNERRELSEVEKPKINALLKDIPDTLERIKALYHYLQENTRYVAIKLGIGGLQPFSAKTVFETGYGDCKALSNYMCSLLEFIGVKSYPALVSSGRYIEPIFNDFPNFQQFDHVILCIPHNTDTIWLECTSELIPFGFLGDFTDDRDVLLITEHGGKFAHTKKYELHDNSRSCRAHFDIDSTGTATCEIKTNFRGLQYDDIAELLYSNSDEQKKLLYKNSQLPSPKINSFSITDFKNNSPSALLNESVVSGNYCSFTGKYMLVPLNRVNAQTPIQKMLKTRNSDILMNRSHIEYDTIVYRIPKNYKAESIPSGKNISSHFGEYSYSVSANENEIIYIRKFIIKQGRYKPVEYNDMYDFFLAVSKADNVKVLLLKKS
jgi:hypothetical protein